FARGRAILRGPASPGRTRARAWMSRPRAQRHSCRAIGAKKAWDPGEARVAPPVFGWRRQWMSRLGARHVPVSSERVIHGLRLAGPNLPGRHWLEALDSGTFPP